MNERILDIGTQEHTQVVCKDKPADGGACHDYAILPTKDKDNEEGLFFDNDIRFQKGPVKETGVNGCHNEDLLAIVIDRLQHFQAGEYSCRENALALTKLQEAMMWLRARTDARKDRGVEGTSVK